MADTPLVQQFCDNCLFGTRIRRESLVEANKELPARQVQCERYPQSMMKGVKQWCGEWKADPDQ